VAMAHEIGRTADAAEFADAANTLTHWINEHLWSERTGFYHDRRADGTLIEDVQTIGAYWALLAGVVPPERLPRFLAPLDDPAAFCCTHRVPSLSANTPGFDPGGGYWRGGVWPPTNYMLLRGLTAVGRADLAHAIGRNHLENVTSSFVSTGTLWENYAPDAAGQGCSTPDFVGWTGLPPVAVLFEDVFGIHADATTQRVVWHVRLTEAHGIANYPVGDRGTLTLRCAARPTPETEPEITATADTDVILDIHWPRGHRICRLPHDNA
ncbi:MAG: trehalase family glycosidase, partial [bacterium]|nr:trehalase family glycosidase [bacterium]